MNTERLIILRDHLRSLPKLRKAGKVKRLFDLSVWARRTDAAEKARTGCGTAACALGEAGYIPEFRALGLKTTTDSSGDVFHTGPNGISTGIYAAKVFFGLDSKQARALFLPDSYPIPRVKETLVADRIDSLLAFGG